MFCNDNRKSSFCFPPAFANQFSLLSSLIHFFAFCIHWQKNISHPQFDTICSSLVFHNHSQFAVFIWNLLIFVYFSANLLFCRPDDFYFAQFSLQQRFFGYFFHFLSMIAKLKIVDFNVTAFWSVKVEIIKFSSRNHYEKKFVWLEVAIMANC